MLVCINFNCITISKFPYKWWYIPDVNLYYSRIGSQRQIRVGEIDQWCFAHPYLIHTPHWRCIFHWVDSKYCRMITNEILSVSFTGSYLNIFRTTPLSVFLVIFYHSIIHCVTVDPVYQPIKGKINCYI